MIRVLLALVMCFAGCCVSNETKVLARQIAKSTETQREEITLLLSDGATSVREEPAVRERVLNRAKKLSEATAGLADILGAEK